MFSYDFSLRQRRRNSNRKAKVTRSEEACESHHKPLSPSFPSVRILAWLRCDPEWTRFLDFLFPEKQTSGLGALRIGLGLLVTVYALFLRSDWHNLFASTGRGLVSRKLGEAITSFDSPLIPKLGWLVALGGYAHIGEDAVLSIAWACLLCMGLLLLLGLFSRPAAIIAWFLHLCAAESGGLFAYGADDFMTTGLFYLMLSPLPDRYSLDHRLLKAELRGPQLLGFGGGFYSAHMCFVYFVRRSGKVPGQRLVEWLQSLAITDPATFFNLHFTGHSCSIQIRTADPRNFDLSDRTRLPIFIWIKKTRLYWLVCILAMHAAIGLAMGCISFRACDDRFESLPPSVSE